MFSVITRTYLAELVSVLLWASAADKALNNLIIVLFFWRNQNIVIRRKTARDNTIIAFESFFFTLL